eukprot:NODE_603_length_6200_cov_0.292739.p2 type:complete len:488 gc:universal NODE_603_length_6200_cov_0.292739:528-1991(+)
MHVAGQLLLKAQLDLDEALYAKILQKLNDIEKPEWDLIKPIIMSGLNFTNTRTVALYIRYMCNFSYVFNADSYLDHPDAGIRGAALFYCLQKRIDIPNICVLMKETCLYNQKYVAEMLLNSNVVNDSIFANITGRETICLYFIEMLPFNQFWNHPYYFRHLVKCCFHENSIIKRLACNVVIGICNFQKKEVFKKVKDYIYSPIQFTYDLECKLLIATALIGCDVRPELKYSIIENWPVKMVYMLVGRLKERGSMFINVYPICICLEVMPVVHYFNEMQQQNIILQLLESFGFDSIVHVNLDLLQKSAQSKATQYAVYLLSGDLESVSLGLAIFSKLPVPFSRFHMLLLYTQSEYLMNIRNAAYKCISLYLTANHSSVDLAMFDDIFRKGLNDEADIRLTCAQSLLFLKENHQMLMEYDFVYSTIYKEDSDQVAYLLSQCAPKVEGKLLELLASFNDENINNKYNICNKTDQVEWLLSVENVVHQDCY